MVVSNSLGRRGALIAGAALIGGCGPRRPVVVAPTPRALDLDRPEDALRAFVKMRGSLGDEDVVFHFRGSVYSNVPGERGKRLFLIEGYNVACTPREGDGYLLLTREMAVYRDPETHVILDRFVVPWTGRDVEVVSVWNDPVSHRLALSGQSGPFRASWSAEGDEIVFDSDVFLLYPSPLPRAQFPESSASDMYQGAELFQFWVRRDDLESAAPSAPARLAWTRLGPFLPWMALGDRPGGLVYRAHGRKLPGGFAELPADLRARVAERGPQFAHAPRTLSPPNETSFTYFKKRAAGAPLPR